MIIETKTPNLYIKDEVPPHWWHAEEEIKQVVAALRKLFKGDRNEKNAD